MGKIIDINNIEIQQEERTMSFLRGEMTQEEEAAFLEELEKNPEFKEKAINMARLAKGMKQVGEEEDRMLMDAFLASDEDTVRRVAKHETERGAIATRQNKYIATILSIAASVCLVAYLGFQYNTGRKTMSLGDQFAAPYQSAVVQDDGGIMRGGNVEDEVEYLVNNVYLNKDLDKTLEQLAELWQECAEGGFSDYYDYAPQIGWALATGYLKDKNKEEGFYAQKDGKLSRIEKEEALAILNKA